MVPNYFQKWGDGLITWRKILNFGETGSPSTRDGQSGPGTGTKLFFSPGPGPKMTGPAYVYAAPFNHGA